VHPDADVFASIAADEPSSQRMTYRTLDSRVRTVAAHLQSISKRGDRALLFFSPGIEFNVAFYACLFAGVTAVPAYPPRPGRTLGRLLAMFSDAGASLVLTTSEHLGGAKALLTDHPALARLHWVATEACEADPETWIHPGCTEEDLAFLQYTSGSTSAPKGVMVTHGNLVHNCSYIRDAIGLTVEDHILSWLPQFHDMGLLAGVLIPPFVGCDSTLMSPMHFLKRPVHWLQAISQLKATVTGGPNFAYQLCTDKIGDEELGALDLSAWRVAFNGAEPIRPRTLDAFAEKFGPCGFRRESFRPCYGLAEATLAVSFSPLATAPVVREFEDDPSEEISRGRSRTLVGCGGPAADQCVRIVDPDTRQECAEGSVGEIWVRGPSVAQGYWNRPEESAATFEGRIANSQEGPFLRTGDLGISSDGQLFVAGRIKDLIIIRGINYYPQDIELTVESCHPALRPGCGAAFAIEDSRGELLVVAQEVAHDAVDELDAGEIAAAIRAAVGEQHEVDVYAVLLVKPGSIPKTSSGKIQRRACRKAYLDGSLPLVGKSIADASDEKAAPAVSHASASRADVEKTYAHIRDYIAHRIALRLSIEPAQVDIRQPFSSLGLHSMAAVELAADLERMVGRTLSPTLAYEYPCIDALAHHLAGSSNLDVTSTIARTHGEPIAIVGMSCRFPGANSTDEFWALLRDGVDAIREIPAERWNIESLYDPNPATPGKMIAKWGGFVDDVDKFDAAFFNISPREAASMDPQQRLLLHVAWEALEHAGVRADRLAGSATGTFIGVSSIDYMHLQLLLGAENDAYVATGNTQSIASNRLSYLLDLRGPSVSVDTACSSALVALHQACQSLRDRECNLALAGGVSVVLSPLATIALSQARMLAPDGRCKAFDASANGYVRSEGCGLVVLKRLSDALTAGDNVLAVVRGTAVNHVGHSNGLTAPSAKAQQAVIRAALENAGVAPSEISYIEAHGTGTSLGDPIEIESIQTVLSEGRDPGNICAVASAKTNVGHLEPAAGIVGLIKTVLALQHETIPPHLHLEKVNPLIKLDESRYQIPTKPLPWPRGSKRRLAGVSAFGFGGANSHAVLEEAPLTPAHLDGAATDRPRHVLTLSARTDAALQRLAGAYATRDFDNPGAIRDLCYSANTGRCVFERRLAIVTEPLDGDGAGNALREALNRAAAGETAPNAIRGTVRSGYLPKMAFLFTGQGAQFAGMGRQLYDTEPTFRATIDRCDAVLREYLEQPLLSVLYPADGVESLINETAYTQPALFALEYALAELWRSWGITPDYVIGHSVGEYAAACFAGMFSLEDGLRLIAERGRLVQSLPAGGKMAAIFTDHATVTNALKGHKDSLSVAAVNGPNLIVVSGEGSALDAIVDQFSAQGVRCTRMTVSHAFHSPLMDPILGAFHDVAKSVNYQPLSIPLVSNRTGQTLEAGETLDADYWRDHIRDAVLFDGGMQALAERGVSVFLEVGPANTLIGMGRRCLPKTEATWLPSLGKDSDNWRMLLTAAATLHVNGIELDWHVFDAGRSRRRLSLPTYPFELKRHWFTIRPGASNDIVQALGGRVSGDNSAGMAVSEEQRSKIAGWFYQVEWESLPQATVSTESGRWLVFADDTDAARSVVVELTARGLSATLVVPGQQSFHGEAHWVVRPDWPEDYEQCLESAFDSNGAGKPGVIVLADSMRAASDEIDGETVLREFSATCRSALFVAQALAKRALSSTAPRMYVVTRSAQSISIDEGAPNLTHAPLWALGRCVALEHPDVMGKLIDIPSDDFSALSVVAEVLTPDGESMVALRVSGRYGARVTPLVDDDRSSQRFALRPDGAYLITGGFGGLGVKVAQWLVRNGARRLILFSRTPLPPRNAWATMDPSSRAGANVVVVRDLEALGASVHVAAVDVSDDNQLAQFLSQYHDEQWPAIRGIIHAAGVLDDQLIHDMDPASFETVGRSKVAGAWNLHRAFTSADLDFFVLFSSAASMFGSVGQGNYAAANAYLDSLAWYRRAKGLPAQSINWGPWAEVGMAAQPDRGGRLAQQGIASIDPEDGLAALGMLLSRRDVQVGVVDADWPALQSLFDAGEGTPFLSKVAGHSKKSVIPSERCKQILESEGEERRKLIQELLCNAIAEVLHTDPAALPMDQNVINLGLDSIMVMDLIRNLGRDLKIRIHPREIFEQPSLAGLAEYIGTELDIMQRKRTGEAPPPEGFIQANINKARGKIVAAPKPERKNPPCVFLLSAPRSGSTLLRVMLAGHSRLFSPPELHILHFHSMKDRRTFLGEGNYLGDGLQRAFMEAQGLDADAAEALIERMFDEDTLIQDVFTRLQESVAPRLLVDKSPTYTGRRETMERAEDLFENPKYIYLYRHPYAVIESYVKNRTGKMFDFGHADPYLLAEEVWASHNENTLAFLKSVPEARQFSVRYEELVTDPERIMQGMCAFLEVPFEPAVLDPYGEGRMTDGVRSKARAIGDPNFMKHTSIDPTLADAWKRAKLPNRLGDWAQRIAGILEYDLPNENLARAVAGSGEELEEERL
jgi:acyl transferase domain-containing protein/acyl-CoA synthetase (AMP-forming)/AMP-acid ligase II/acyl carrier protein